MHFGGAMFFADYSMSAMELARALEERGFESVWAPEHSHIPLSRRRYFQAAATCDRGPHLWQPALRCYVDPTKRSDRSALRLDRATGGDANDRFSCRAAVVEPT